MSFLLKNLELAIPENFFVLGEKLLEDGKVKNLHESQRNLWVAEVEQFETEIQITSSKVKALTCECESFQRAKMCPHLAAALLALRRLPDTHKLPDTHQKEKQEIKKLTINAILGNVSYGDLAAFVRRYAKTNQAFALALKARFAAKVSTTDNKEKYLQLLESALQPLRKKNGRFGKSAIGQVSGLAADLLGLADDSVVLGHFSEALAIAQAMFEKIPPLLSRCDGDPSPLTDILSKCFYILHRLIDESDVPSVKENLWRFCLEKCNQPLFRQLGFSAYFFNLLRLLAADDSKRRSLLHAIDNELAAFHHSNERVVFLMLKWELLEDRTNQDELRGFWLDVLSSPEQVVPLLAMAIEKGRVATAKEFAGIALRFLPEAFHLAVEEVLLRISHLTGDAHMAVEYANSLFLATFQADYYTRCKQHYQGDWGVFVQQIVASLKETPSTPSKIEALAFVLAEESMYRQLFDLLEEQQSLDLLMRYDRYLLNEYPAQVYSLYEKLLTSYLDSHIGQIASRKTATVLNHLYGRGAAELAGKLAETFRHIFGKRTSLMEELSLFNH